MDRYCFVQSKEKTLMFVEAAAGVEPANSGFADRSLSHLGTPPQTKDSYYNNMRNRTMNYRDAKQWL